MRPLSIPTGQPTSIPTKQPSSQPTIAPSNQPFSLPSSQPSNEPSRQPSNEPSSIPSSHPSAPSKMPSSQPTSQPSIVPSSQPSLQPFSCPTSQPVSVPTSHPSPTSHNTVGQVGVSFTVNQAISNVTVAQFKRGESAFVQTVIWSLNSTGLIEVVITNVTQTYSRRRILLGVPSVQVQYSITFYVPAGSAGSSSIAVYSKLSNNLMNSIASGNFAGQLSTSCGTSCGLANVVPTFTQPILSTTYSPSLEPTVEPTGAPARIASASSAAGGGLDTGTLLMAVLAIVAIVLGMICFALVMVRMKRKRNITEKRLEHWLGSESSEIDIHKNSRNLRKGFLQDSSDPGIKDIYEKLGVEKVQSTFNPVFNEPGKVFNQNDSSVDNIKRQSLRNFVTSLHELRKEKFSGNVEADLTTITDLFTDESSSKPLGKKMNNSPADSHDLAKILRKFHAELQSYRDKSAEVDDPTDGATAHSEGESKVVDDSDIDIMELYKDESNPFYADV